MQRNLKPLRIDYSHLYRKHYAVFKDKDFERARTANVDGSKIFPESLFNLMVKSKVAAYVAFEMDGEFAPEEEQSTMYKISRMWE